MADKRSWWHIMMRRKNFPCLVSESKSVRVTQVVMKASKKRRASPAGGGGVSCGYHMWSSVSLVAECMLMAVISEPVRIGEVTLWCKSLENDVKHWSVTRSCRVEVKPWRYTLLNINLYFAVHEHFIVYNVFVQLWYSGGYQSPQIRIGWTK